MSATQRAVEAKDLTNAWIGRTVNAIGVHTFYPKQGEYVVIRHVLTEITHLGDNVRLNFASRAELLVKPNSWVLDVNAIRPGEPYVAPPVVVGGVPQP